MPQIGQQEITAMRLPIESAHKTAGYLTLVPAYGRDYKSKREVMEAWDAGKDFIVQDMMSPYDGKPINKADAKAAGIRNVNIRFKGMRSVAVIKVAKTAFGEKMQSATEREYNAALRNAPRARKEHIDGGPRSMTVEHKDRGTLVASKTILYSRGKVSQEMYMVNADYLPGGSMSRQAKFPEGKKMTVDEVAEVVGPEFKEMNEDPPESVKKVRKEMEEAMDADLLPVERAASEQQADKLEAEAEANEAQAEADRQKADAARMKESAARLARREPEVNDLVPMGKGIMGLVEEVYPDEESAWVWTHSWSYKFPWRDLKVVGKTRNPRAWKREQIDAKDAAVEAAKAKREQDWRTHAPKIREVLRQIEPSRRSADLLPIERAAKKKLPDELKKHQFTGKGGKNPPPADADGDGKTNEPKPDFLKEKGKKAAGKVSRSGWSYTPEEWLKHAETAFSRLGAKDADDYKRLAKEQKKKMSFPSDGSSGQYDAWVDAMAWAMGEFSGSGKKASLRRAARRHFAGRRYDYDEVIDFLTEDKSTPELERMWKKWSEMVEDLHDRWFEGWAEANAPELLDESIDYKELAWKAFGSTTGMGIGLWEGDFLGDKHDKAFEKVVERDSKVSRFGQDLDDEISMAREGDDEESMRMASRRKSASGNHHVAPNGDIFVDTAFLNSVGRIPGVSLSHMGFGEFYADTPKGRVDFDRMRGKDFPGQSGRSHKLYGEGNAADWLLDQMIRRGQSVESGSRMASDQMIRKAFVPDSVDGWLEWEDGSRTAARKTAMASYGSLNDAALVTGDDRYDKGGTKVWYTKPDFTRDMRKGYNWLVKQRGRDLSGWTIQIPTARSLADTHVLLGTVQERNPEAVYSMMQGENWSPQGEARALIRSKGLEHTSMSVGDILQVGSNLFMVDRFGFEKISSGRKLRG